MENKTDTKKKTTTKTKTTKTKTSKTDKPITLCNNTISPAVPLSEIIANETSSLSDKVNNINKFNVNYVYLGPDHKEPQYAHNGDIGMDIVATGVEYNEEYDCYIYHTGFYAESLKKMTGCFIMPRSSNYKTDAYLCNSIGLVDSFIYRGEFCIIYKNRTTLGQEIMDVLFYGYLSLPFYKRIFISFKKYVEENTDIVKATCLEKAKNMVYAPYNVGDRIAQLVWVSFPEVQMNRLDSVNELSVTERGSNGFGSTGK